MTDRPIIFSGAMVRALLDGRKTQTRRLATSPLRKCERGDRLYVRETSAQVFWRDIFTGQRSVQTSYKAGRRMLIPEGGEANQANWPAVWKDDHIDQGQKWTPSIHMLRKHSRLTLIVEDVRVEPLQDLNPRDAVDEGIEPFQPDGHSGIEDCLWLAYGPPLPTYFADPVDSYRSLWDLLHSGPGQRWEDNPDVLVLTFRVQSGNIDRIAA